MPQIMPFRGIRYNLAHVGPLSDVVAPPYDVIDQDLQDKLYKRHPSNAVRLILNREEPGDNDESNRYSRAAKFLRNWLAEGMLFQDPQPAVYVYHQEFENLGQRFTRRGFMARVKLERFGEGKIYPHEETHAAAKKDRLKLIKGCQANLSQIFGIYPDPENLVQSKLESAIQNVLPVEAVDHLGVVHRVWNVTDLDVLTQVTSDIADQPLFIADGHHRYETGCDYRDHLAQTEMIDSGHPANYILAMCVGMDDPGLLVLPTHRLFRGLQPQSSAEVTSSICEYFDVEQLGVGIERAHDAWLRIESIGEQGNLAFYCRQDDTWLLANITDRGRQRMEEISGDHCADWRNLGVSILHNLVMDLILSGTPTPQPMYVHDVNAVIEGMRRGDTQGRDATGQEGKGGDFELAALVMPASLEHIRTISSQHERMPAKSTYFYPKLLSGLVFNLLHK